MARFGNGLAAWILGCSAAIGLADEPPAALPAAVVLPTVETTPVAGDDDAADDPAVWIDPADPAKSLIVATDKSPAGGLGVYGLDGKLLQFVYAGRLNNVDLRQGVRIGRRTLDLVAAGHRDKNDVLFYRVDAAARRLEPLPAKALALGTAEPYGLGLGVGKAGQLYVFVADKAGVVEQWEILDEAGRLAGKKVRRLQLPGQCEGLCCDDELGRLYIGVEAAGVFRAGLDPASGTSVTQIDGPAPAGHLVPDIEGIALRRGPNGAGLLVVSSQGDNAYAAYQRGGDNRFLFRFRIGDNAALGIDGTEDTDGIEIASVGCGPRFPQGFLVTQDGKNAGGKQNFKLVPWEAIAKLNPPPASF